MNPLDVLRGLRLLGRAEVRRALASLGARQRVIDDLRLRHPCLVIDERAVILGDVGAIRIEQGNSTTRVSAGTVFALADRSELSYLSIGGGTYIGEYCNLRTAQHTHVEIGRRCLIAQFVTMVSSNHRLSDRTPVALGLLSKTREHVVVGDDVWVGAGAIILPGARIGEGAVIAAGAVVSGEVRAFEIWGGVPARKLGERPLTGTEPAFDVNLPREQQ